MSEKGFSTGEKVVAVAGLALAVGGATTAAVESANAAQEVASAQKIIAEVANPNDPLGEQLTHGERETAQLALDKNPVDPSDISILRDDVHSENIVNDARGAVEVAYEDLEQAQHDKGIQTAAGIGTLIGVGTGAGAAGLGIAGIAAKNSVDSAARRKGQPNPQQ